MGTSESRAAGTLTDDSDNKIGEFTAYVFAGDQLQAIMVSSTGASVTETVKVTTAANAIYVIANANGASELTSITEKVTTKSTFLATVANLISSNAFNAKSTAGNVWASGYVAIASTDYTGSNNAASKSVAVAPISARINVTVDDQRTNLTDPAAWDIIGVQMRNVAGTTPFIAPSAFSTPTSWYNGAAGDNAAATVTTYYNDTYNATGHMFYAFDNDATTYSTVVTLVTSNDSGATLRYYPVHFTATDAGSTVERGNSYQVAIKLTGDAKDDTGITTPEEPIELAQLTVSVTATNWNMVGINKEF